MTFASDQFLAAPGWVHYLNGRLPDETPHIDDDFFGQDSSGDYTEVDVTGTTTWLTKNGLLSVLYEDQTAGDLGAYLKPITSASAPITIETRVQVWADLSISYDQEIGIIFTDGTASTSNLYGFSFVSSQDGKPQIHSINGTLTAMTEKTNIASTTTLSGMSGIYMRAVWVSSNTFAVSWSVTGTQWTDYAIADDSVTLAPTHIGVFVTSQAGTLLTNGGFDYLRVYDSDLSV